MVWKWWFFVAISIEYPAKPSEKAFLKSGSSIKLIKISKFILYSSEAESFEEEKDDCDWISVSVSFNSAHWAINSLLTANVFSNNCLYIKIYDVLSDF